MTFEQIVQAVRKYQAELSPAEARQATERLVSGMTVWIDGWPVAATIDGDRVLAFAAGGKPSSEENIGGLLRRRRAPAQPPVVNAGPPVPAPAQAVAPKASPPAPPPAELAKPARPPETRSARRLLKALLRRPRSETDVRLAIAAAEISPRTLAAAVAALGVQTGVAAAFPVKPMKSLIVAADALGVRSRREQWWLPR